MNLQETSTIPQRLLNEVLVYWPYAKQERVMFQFLMVTGCRITELDAMKPENLVKNAKGQDIIYWVTGKTGGYRFAEIPAVLMSEYIEYRQTNRTFPDKLFGMKSESFGRKFNGIRKYLSIEWNEYKMTMKEGILVPEYKYQLKMVRKNFNTLTFNRLLIETGNASLALELTKKLLNHQSVHMNILHYYDPTNKDSRLPKEQLLKEVQCRL